VVAFNRQQSTQFRPNVAQFRAAVAERSSTAWDVADALALILAAVWLGAVVWNGNAGRILSTFAADRAFVPWLVGVLVLWLLTQVDAIRPAVVPFAFMAAIGVGLVAIGNGTAAPQLQRLAGIFKTTPA